MASKSQLLLAVAACYMIFSTCSTVSSSIPIEGKNLVHDRPGSSHPLLLEYVGSVEGKSYYADSTAQLTWTQAGDYCRAHNLRFASIETQAQVQMLNASLPELEKFGIVLFTSGREAHGWNESQVLVDESLFDGSFFRNGYFYCVYLYFSGQGTMHMGSENCAYTFGVLCEGDVEQ